jgi:hypothetical protein
MFAPLSLMKDLFEKLARASDSDQHSLVVGLIVVAASAGGAVLFSAIAL